MKIPSLHAELLDKVTRMLHPPSPGGQQEGVGELKNKTVRKMMRSF